MKYKLIMNGLDCAHCAGKIEQTIAKTEGFENVSLVFATKSLYFEHEENSDMVKIIQEITDSIEDGVTVSESVHEHTHSGCCHDEEEHHHDHAHEHNESKLSRVLLFVAIGFAVAAIVLEAMKLSEIAIAILSAIAIVLSGYKVCISGVKSVLKLRLDETTLMTVAVIAAFCLGQFVEGAMVTILFGIGELLEDKAVENSRRSIEKLANIQANTANVLMDGVESVVNTEDVAVGSTIVIKPHERIPLDCVVTKGSGSVDTSAITGESIPLDCEIGAELMSGMLNGETMLEARTTKEYRDSTASRIIQLVEEASTTKSNNEKLITRFAAVYTPIVTLISLAIMFIPPIFVGDLSEWIYRGLVCLVASCPCAIVISVPLSYYSGIGAASKCGVLIKGGKFLEALAAADTAVFDKTGTLTEGKLSIDKITPYNGYSTDEVLALAAACEKNSSHPIARAITAEYNGEEIELSDYKEKSGYGVSAMYNGKELICGSRKLVKDKDVDGTVVVIYDDKLIGSIKVSDSVRVESHSIIDKLKSFGFKNLVMLTGDAAETAKNVSEKLGLTEYHGDLLPQNKVEIVSTLKEQSKGVVFVGDGINDSPVIAASDCGFAMGLGSDAAIAAADAVLTSGTLSALPKAIRIAKKTVATSKTNIAFALAVKALVIILAFFGIAAIWMSVIADTGVCLLCVLYAMRILKIRK
ncbi:MAG: cadmium-translocating P-type ATPase [Ruminococcus sp.]|nr:cadmium-translocating P-type ATPase [Ruminococcus sp.]